MGNGLLVTLVKAHTLVETARRLNALIGHQGDRRTVAIGLLTGRIGLLTVNIGLLTARTGLLMVNIGHLSFSVGQW